MGTTVTPNLGLIKPDQDESIKQALPTFAGWAAQNGANMDVIDGLFRASTSTWTPTWGGTTTNPTLGTSGFVEGKFLRLWPRMVIAHFRIFTGTASFTAGAGTYTLTLPVAVPPEFALFDTEVPIGKAIILDADTVANCSVMQVMYDIATGKAVMHSPGGNLFQPTNPITIAVNDRISGYMMYPTSVP